MTRWFRVRQLASVAGLRAEYFAKCASGANTRETYFLNIAQICVVAPLVDENGNIHGALLTVRGIGKLGVLGDWQNICDNIGMPPNLVAMRDR